MTALDIREWSYPTRIIFGCGAVQRLPELCKSLAMSAPLFVTDEGLREAPIVTGTLDLLRAGGLATKCFSDVFCNPTAANVEAGLAAFQRGGHDGVIAFGGGSGLDAGKAIAVIANQSCSLWDLEDIGDNWLNADADNIPPIIGVPTTAGTGSEVGRASVIVNEEEHKKTIIFHPKMLPACVILDPELTVGLPAGLTAATGMDALSHNLEAFCAPGYHPMAEGIAIEGIRLIKEYLPSAVADGGNIEARTQMLVASSMGATAFQRGLGGMHALAHPLGATYDAHHGMLNAILMPYILKANVSAIDTRIGRLARYLDLEPDFDSFLNWVLAMREAIGIPHALSAIIPEDSRLSEIGEMAVVDPSAGSNPILHDAKTYTKIARSAYNGSL